MINYAHVIGLAPLDVGIYWNHRPHCNHGTYVDDWLDGEGDEGMRIAHLAVGVAEHHGLKFPAFCGTRLFDGFAPRIGVRKG